MQLGWASQHPRITTGSGPAPRQVWVHHALAIAMPCALVQLAQPGVVTFPPGSVAFHMQYGAPGCGCPPQPCPCGPTLVGWRPILHCVWFVICSHVGQSPAWAAAAPTRARARMVLNMFCLEGGGVKKCVK